MALAPKQATTPKQAPKPPVATKTAPAANKPKGGFAGAKPRSVRQYLRAISQNESAEYIVRVNKVVQVWANPRAVEEDRPQPTDEELQTAKKAFKGQDAYSYEVEVIETNHPDIKPGGIYSVTTNDKYPESYFADIKGFICACTGAEPEQVDLDDWQASYQPDQPFAGKIIKLVVHEQKNKNNDGVFTKVLPRALDEDEAAQFFQEHPELAEN